MHAPAVPGAVHAYLVVTNKQVKQLYAAIDWHQQGQQLPPALPAVRLLRRSV
jgi:hypothetical protein